VSKSAAEGGRGHSLLYNMTPIPHTFRVLDDSHIIIDKIDIERAPSYGDTALFIPLFGPIMTCRCAKLCIGDPLGGGFGTWSYRMVDSD
jgi:hypothetical protein